MMQPVDLILVEDHPLFLMGVKAALSNHSHMRVVGETDSSNGLEGLLRAHHVQLILLDIKLPKTSGIEIARWVRADYPNVKILVLSSETSESTILELVEIGVNGFISKQEPMPELIRAIESVMSGYNYYGKDIAKIIHDVSIARNQPDAQFTKRELEIIALSAEMSTASEIADKLSLSPRTVESHKYTIFQKLGINSTVELIKYAVQKGIINL